MLLQAALAPVLIVLFYIYIRDKYEKEPFKLLFTGVLFGVIICAPIVFVENIISGGIPESGGLKEAFLTSFFVASAVEEFFKFIVLFFLTWKNRNLNEWFDGIVYSVFISLGFAGFENILYVFNPEMGGMETALLRAVFSIPGHALFGVCMGYYFSLARFCGNNRAGMLLRAFIVPFFLHGTYDFILLADFNFLFFVVFVVYLWISGFRKIKRHIQNSPFKN